MKIYNQYIYKIIFQCQKIIFQSLYFKLILKDFIIIFYILYFICYFYVCNERSLHIVKYILKHINFIVIYDYLQLLWFLYLFLYVSLIIVGFLVYCKIL